MPVALADGGRRRAAREEPPGDHPMHRVMLLNPKGGSGKTTIATSLASVFAARGHVTALVDHDAQGSSTRWLRVRPAAYPAIHGVEAYRNPTGVTRAWLMRTPPGTDRVVVDTPAGVRAAALLDLIRRAHSIVIPVLPSHIDIDAVSAFIEELRALEPVRSGETRVAVVANRVRTRTRVFHDLEAFLRRADFPFVTRLRDSQSYVHAAERGVGIHELSAAGARTDRRQWRPLLAWLEGEPVRPPEPVAAPEGDAAARSYPLPL